MSEIDEIKDRLDIVELVSETVQLKRAGRNYTGFCPFHSNTRTPAFVVFPDTGTWRCFGQCNDGGDIFSFVMKREGWDFSEALRMLAERAGVELKPLTPQAQEAAEEHDNLRVILEEAVTFFRHHLMNTTAGKDALDYLLEKRRLSEGAIEAFGLGYAPESWEVLTGHFTAKGHTPADLLACGLVSEREGGGVYDRFRHRIVFPIRDARGRMAGFGARVLDPEDVPKFLNSPQTVLFDKGGLLYGLDRARKSIRAQDRAVIVEGYLDVIALHQAGYTTAVSPMGTALTEMQLRLVKRFTRNIVLALDSDAAGDQATLRGLQVARQALDRESDPVFDARGLLGYEARMQADIRVTTLPEGLDPDDVVNRDPAEWERILDNARPIVVHVMDAAVAGRDLEDAKVKSEIAGQVLPLIADLPDPIERDTYRQRLARLLRVDERTLLESAAPSRSRRRPRRAPAEAGPARPDSVRADSARDPRVSRMALESHCLGVLLRRPDLVYRLDRELQADGLARLGQDDFQSAEHQLILRLIAASLEQDHAEPLYYVLDNLDLSLMELADRMLERTEKLDPNDERVLEDLLRTILALRRRQVSQQLEHMRFLMEDAQESGDVRAADFQQTMAHYLRTRQVLDKALGRYTSHALDPGSRPLPRMGS